VNKNNLSEDDISVKYITASLHKSNWMIDTQIRRQVSFTKGQIIVRGKLASRGKAKKADFVPHYQHFPVALIEAKKSIFPAGHGMQQALGYATTLEAETGNGDSTIDVFSMLAPMKATRCRGRSSR
jgi:type I restriction enzyme, R subunit